MSKIYKYQFNKDGYTKLPMGARILRIDKQNGDFCVWALVDPKQTLVDRDIRIYGTGWDILEDEGVFINTILDGPLVWHFFDYGEVFDETNTQTS